MKVTKLLAIILLLFISSTIFAQRVHYKDSYYTIVKSKIFHRGHDVFGKLSSGRIDTIHIIAKELYTERGKLKNKYKKRKKRDRYNLPEGFWEKNKVAVAEAANENKSREITTELDNAKDKKAEVLVKEASTSLKEETKNTEEKVISNQDTKHKETEKVQKAADSVREEEKVKENSPQQKDKIERERKEDQQKAIKEKKEANAQSKENDKIERERKEEQNRIEEEKEQKTAQKKSVDEQEKSVKVQKEKATESENKKSDKKQQNRKSKEIKDQRNKTENIEKKQAKEAKNLEKSKKSLEETEKKQLKKQQLLEAKEAALTSTSTMNTSTADEDTFGTIYIKVNKEKTNTTSNGAILLFFDVINNSNKDLVILRPHNSMDNRLDFFSNTMECEDIPIKSTDYIAKDLNIKNDDYLTIPANGKIELFINGMYRNWLACSSDDVILQIQYNPFKSAEEGIELPPIFKKGLSTSLKKITPIKIESENIKFKLNKQE